MAWADDDAFDFSVDDLLVEPEQEGIDDEDDDQEGEAGSLETYNRSSPKSSDNLQHKYNPSIELDLFHITEDVAELEWVSRFVDDSFFEYPPSPSFSAAPATGVLSWRPIMVPVKARSKRPRKSFSASASNNSSTTSSTSSSARNGNLIESKKRGRKKKKKKIERRERECSHCGVEKTPQWRAGPAGAKTLCNACGVRFKSGRLLPEYRPACSPTFVSSVHSNSHRKVLEMRRVKDQDEQLQLGFC